MNSVGPRLLPSWPFMILMTACLSAAVTLAVIQRPLTSEFGAVVAFLVMASPLLYAIPHLVNALRLNRDLADNARLTADREAQRLGQIVDEIKEKAEALERAVVAGQRNHPTEGGMRAALEPAFRAMVANAEDRLGNRIDLVRKEENEHGLRLNQRIEAQAAEIKALQGQLAELRAQTANARDLKGTNDQIKARIDDMQAAFSSMRMESANRAETILKAESAARAQAMAELQQALSSEISSRQIAVNELRQVIAAEAAARAQLSREIRADLVHEAEAREEVFRRAEAAARGETGALAETINVLELLIRAETEKSVTVHSKLHRDLQDIREAITGTPGAALPSEHLAALEARLVALETETQTLRAAQEAYAGMVVATRKASGVTRLPFASRNPFHPPAEAPADAPSPAAAEPEPWKEALAAIEAEEQQQATAAAAEAPTPEPVSTGEATPAGESNAMTAADAEPVPSAPAAAPLPTEFVATAVELPLETTEQLPREPMAPEAMLAASDPISGLSEELPAAPADFLPEAPAADRHLPTAEDATGGGMMPETFAEAMPAPTGLVLRVVAEGIAQGTTLYLRGTAPGLSWEQGVPMQLLPDGRWEWTLPTGTEAAWCHVYANDHTAAWGYNLQLWPGSPTEAVVQFPQ